MSMISAATAPREFFCPDWPGCQCPDGTMALDCPGRRVTAPSTVPAEKRKTRHARDADGVVWEVFADEDVSDWAVEIDASSGSGGPARAIDPDEAVAVFRRQLQSPSWTPADASPSASLKERAERLLAEMKAVLDRSDDALWMVKRELGHRKDLLDAAFAAHVDMGFVSRDLRELIKEL